MSQLGWPLFVKVGEKGPQQFTNWTIIQNWIIQIFFRIQKTAGSQKSQTGFPNLLNSWVA